MSMPSVDHWDDLPRFETMRRPVLRADASKNPVKFGKTSRSLERLRHQLEGASAHDEASSAIGIFRKRLSRAFQLSETPLRIARGTNGRYAQHANEVEKELAKGLEGAVAAYEASRLETERREAAGMTQGDIDDARFRQRKAILERKLLAIDPTAFDESEARLEDAEAFAALLDETAVPLTPDGRVEPRSARIDTAAFDDPDAQLAAAEALTAYWDDRMAVPPRAADGRSNVHRVWHEWEVEGETRPEY